MILTIQHIQTPSKIFPSFRDSFLQIYINFSLALIIGIINQKTLKILSNLHSLLLHIIPSNHTGLTMLFLPSFTFQLLDPQQNMIKVGKIMFNQVAASMVLLSWFERLESWLACWFLIEEVAEKDVAA